MSFATGIALPLEDVKRILRGMSSPTTAKDYRREARRHLGKGYSGEPRRGEPQHAHRMGLHDDRCQVCWMSGYDILREEAGLPRRGVCQGAKDGA